VLVCHEEYPGRQDDGWIADFVRRRFQHVLPVISGRHSAAELKAVIGELDLIVASRFHSVVAAISMQTAVVTLGWAHKYDELMWEAGLEGLVLDALNDAPDAILERVQRAWAGRQQLRRRMDGTPERLKGSARTAFDYVVEVVPPAPK
jgi:polysaccharide pyruvyl transferase WcaK-like protein